MKKMLQMWYTRFMKEREKTNPPYAAEDIARYIIKVSNEKGYGVSNLKLQKLLYFVQAHFLVDPEFGYRAFPEKIVAWNLGPVVPSVYRTFRRFGAMDIPFERTFVVEDKTSHWGVQKKEYSDDVISNHDKEGIQYIIEYFKDYSPIGIMQLTHNQDPWNNAYEPDFPHKNNEITLESIKEYFSDDETLQ